MHINLTTPMTDDKERQQRNKAVLDAIEQYTEERMNDEYGRIHTDGSRSGGQPTQSDALREASEHERFYKTVPMVGTIPENSRGGGGTGLQPVVIRKGVAACTDRIGGAGVVTHGIVGVVTQSDAVAEGVLATQKAHTMVREVLAEWGIEPSNTTPEQLTIATTEALCRAIDQQDDLRAQAQAQYDRGYYDGCANPIVRHDALRDALADLLHAVCGENGFVQAVRWDSGRIYPWPALDLAEAKARAALGESK